MPVKLGSLGVRSMDGWHYHPTSSHCMRHCFPAYKGVSLTSRGASFAYRGPPISTEGRPILTVEPSISTEASYTYLRKRPPSPTEGPPIPKKGSYYTHSGVPCIYRGTTSIYGEAPYTQKGSPIPREGLRSIGIQSIGIQVYREGLSDPGYLQRIAYTQKASYAHRGTSFKYKGDSYSY